MPPISQAVAQVYRDVFHCIGELRALALIVLLITFGFQIAETLLLPRGDGDISRDLLLRFLSNLAQGLLTVPYYIAVHRLVILGERTTSYVLAPSHPRFQLFFWWWAALSVVMYLPISLVDMLTPSRGAIGLRLLALAGLPILLIAIIIIMLRLTIIFPAIAVDAPGATWRNVMADTKGYVWRIFLLGLVACLPLLVPALGLTALFGFGTSGSWVGKALIMAIAAVLSVIGQTLFIVIASRIYLWIGDRTKRA